MGVNSKIEWTHHTFNPWWGCTRVSPACKHCYAETWAKRLGQDGLWGSKTERRFFSDSHWREPLKWNREAAVAGERRRVFCASMADVFENRRDLDASRNRLWRLIEETPNLDWLLLTKRIQHVEKLVPWSGEWPKNVWLGTTAETQKWLEKRVEHLLKHAASVRFLSAEPLLGPLTLSQWLQRPGSSVAGINWVIAGGESGPESRHMHPAWAEDLRDQCLQAGVPFHFKQWGHWAPEELIQETISVRTQRIELVGRAGELIRMVKVGKNKGGRILAGQYWDQIP
ncbi:hypothetical protein LMG6871_02488 [Ralstonia edaphis]|uniref:phage Gp37/Gp68 family protein n=1 Tax=Ralstonia edaphi TaxID=3058599 RepID=UPI0028F4D08C|nr:phage Gp37/Gp68 family protein [Ralstonia sp. LMG 6871]CAJ0718530.1 hypothetical protein LMG6871_02488 [Ralstonia sp. LMG 6871]